MCDQIHCGTAKEKETILNIIVTDNKTGTCTSLSKSNYNRLTGITWICSSSRCSIFRMGFFVVARVE